MTCRLVWLHSSHPFSLHPAFPISLRWAGARLVSGQYPLPGMLWARCARHILPTMVLCTCPLSLSPQEPGGRASLQDNWGEGLRANGSPRLGPGGSGNEA